MLTDQDRDTLILAAGQAAMEALDRARDDPGATLLEAWRRMGEAALAVILPADTLPVPVAELAALREFVRAVLAHEALDEPTREEHNASVDRVRAAMDGVWAVTEEV